MDKKIISPLGNMNRQMMQQPQSQAQPQRKMHFVSDDSNDHLFEIPEGAKMEESGKVEFTSAEQFNQFRNQYLKKDKEEKKQVSLKNKENIEFLLGLGLKTDIVKIGNFAFFIRSLNSREIRNAKKEVEKLKFKDETFSEEEYGEELRNRYLASAIFAIGDLNGEDVAKKMSFEDFISSDSYEYKLQCVSSMQEPVLQALIEAWLKLTLSVNNQFKTQESLSDELKK